MPAGYQTQGQEAWTGGAQPLARWWGNEDSPPGEGSQNWNCWLTWWRTKDYLEKLFIKHVSHWTSYCLLIKYGKVSSKNCDIQNHAPFLQQRKIFMVIIGRPFVQLRLSNSHHPIQPVSSNLSPWQSFLSLFSSHILIHTQKYIHNLHIVYCTILVSLTKTVQYSVLHAFR